MGSFLIKNTLYSITELSVAKGRQAKLICGIVMAPITSLFNTHRPVGLAIAFAPKVQIWLQSDIGTLLSLIYFFRGKESQPLPITHAPQTEVLSYLQEIILAGMYLKHHFFIGFVHLSSGSQEVSICPLGFRALHPPPKGLLCPFFHELRRDLSILSEHHCIRVTCTLSVLKP